MHHGMHEWTVTCFSVCKHCLERIVITGSPLEDASPALGPESCFLLSLSWLLAANNNYQIWSLLVSNQIFVLKSDSEVKRERSARTRAEAETAQRAVLAACRAWRRSRVLPPVQAHCSRLAVEHSRATRTASLCCQKEKGAHGLTAAGASGSPGCQLQEGVSGSWEETTGGGPPRCSAASSSAGWHLNTHSNISRNECKWTLTSQKHKDKPLLTTHKHRYIRYINAHAHVRARTHTCCFEAQRVQTDSM